ncbi:hypothetical protein ACFQBS_02905 [Planomonospora parontospora]|uniref:hypothetical protein n=1 Tax=Planomonospora parontospora TaxID=58119 RepID=UPI00361B8BF9
MKQALQRCAKLILGLSATIQLGGNGSAEARHRLSGLVQQWGGGMRRGHGAPISLKLSIQIEPQYIAYTDSVVLAIPIQ